MVGYPSPVPSVFRRKSTDLVTEPEAETQPVPDTKPRGYTPKKGEATPKRPVANRRLAEPPPTNRKEALARSRVKSRESRAEQRAGLMNGDDRYLTARDKGPIRLLVRNIVDSRRNVGSIFFAVTIAVLVCSMIPIWSIQLGANLAFVALLLTIMVDSVALSRRVKRVVTERFPKNQERWGSLYFYAIMRAVNFRKMRVPKPKVNTGDEI